MPRKPTYHDEKHRKHREYMRQHGPRYKAKHERFMAEWREAAPAPRILDRNVTGKHLDRPLPVWGLILACLADGRFYTSSVVHADLERRHGVPRNSVKALLQLLYRRGQVQKHANPSFDPAYTAGRRLGAMARKTGTGGRAFRGRLEVDPRASRLVFSITEKGRAALAAVELKYKSASSLASLAQSATKDAAAPAGDPKRPIDAQLRQWEGLIDGCAIPSD